MPISGVARLAALTASVMALPNDRSVGIRRADHERVRCERPKIPTWRYEFRAAKKAAACDVWGSCNSRRKVF